MENILQFSQQVISLAELQDVLQNTVGLSVSSVSAGKKWVLHLGTSRQVEAEVLPNQWLPTTLHEYSVELGPNFQFFKDGVALAPEQTINSFIFGLVKTIRFTLNSLCGTKVQRIKITSNLELNMSFSGNYQIRDTQYTRDDGESVVAWRLITPAFLYQVETDGLVRVNSSNLMQFTTRPLSI